MIPLDGDAGGGPPGVVRALLRHPPARFGLLLLGAIALLCALGPPVLGLDPWTTAPSLGGEPPSFAHPFGTDPLGRDLLARVLVGGRTSLLIGVLATLSAVGIGVVYGSVAGYVGGRTDELLMRLVDLLYGVPYMFLVILIMLLFSDTARGDPLPVFTALGLVQWLTLARIVRGQVRSLRHRDYVLAARALGAGDLAILGRHVLPGVAGPVVVYATLTVPEVIILESFLSFLGLGLTLSWGQLVADGVAVLSPLRGAWWLLLFPAGFLSATLLALHFVGDGLRDALDPRSAGRSLRAAQGRPPGGSSASGGRA